MKLLVALFILLIIQSAKRRAVDETIESEKAKEYNKNL